MSQLRIFQGAIAIVTGGGSGIGKALAGELAARGAHVVIADIEAADAENVAADLRTAGRSAAARQLDVTRQPDVEKLVADTFAEHGRLDYLFNNAGIGAVGEAHEYELKAWTRVIDVNINGVVYGVHAAYPRMVKQGFGHIISTASLAGLITTPMLVSYTLTKHAVVGMSKGLRIEGETFGVRVSALCPGVIRTPILQGGKHGVLLETRPPDEQRRMFGKLIEQMRPADPASFARAVIDQVASNTAIIVVPGWYKLTWWMERLCLPLSLWLNRKFLAHGRAMIAAETGKRP